MHVRPVFVTVEASAEEEEGQRLGALGIDAARLIGGIMTDVDDDFVCLLVTPQPDQEAVTENLKMFVTCVRTLDAWQTISLLRHAADAVEAELKKGMNG